jgi:hypothetical protein
MRKQILFVICIFGSLSISAQTRHEISIYAGLGSSTLAYDFSKGEKSNGMGGAYGFGYTLFFTENIGISTGLGFASYKAEVDVRNTSCLLSGLKDEDGDIYNLTTKLDRYPEKQTVSYLKMPLMLQFQTTGSTGFYLRAGVKLGFPSSGKYESERASFTNEGYYPEYDNTIPRPAFKGFGSFKGRDVQGDLDAKFTCFFALETGVKFRISDKMLLYMGLYYDLGLNDIRKETGTDFLIPNAENSENFTNNSILTSHDGNGTDFTGKVSPRSVGLDIRLAYAF